MRSGSTRERKKRGWKGQFKLYNVHLPFLLRFESLHIELHLRVRDSSQKPCHVAQVV